MRRRDEHDRERLLRYGSPGFVRPALRNPQHLLDDQATETMRDEDQWFPDGYPLFGEGLGVAWHDRQEASSDQAIAMDLRRIQSSRRQYLECLRPTMLAKTRTRRFRLATCSVCHHLGHV